MKSQPGIRRREVFRKLASSAGAVAVAAAVPGSAAFAQDPASSSGRATVRVILADGNTVQWLGVTNGGLTVGGATAIIAGRSGLNASIVKEAIAAIVAAGGPRLSGQNVILLGGAS